MPLRARHAADDLARFALMAAAALALTALWLIAVRLWFGDGPNAVDAALVGTIAILTLALLAGAGLVGLANRAGLASLLSIAAGLVLLSGGTALLALIVPQAFEAAGPGATAMLLPLLTSLAAIPLGLGLRAVAALI